MNGTSLSENRAWASPRSNQQSRTWTLIRPFHRRPLCWALAINLQRLPQRWWRRPPPGTVGIHRRRVHACLFQGVSKGDWELNFPKQKNENFSDFKNLKSVCFPRARRPQCWVWECTEQAVTQHAKCCFPATKHSCCTVRRLAGTPTAHKEGGTGPRKAGLLQRCQTQPWTQPQRAVWFDNIQNKVSSNLFREL